MASKDKKSMSIRLADLYYLRLNDVDSDEHRIFLAANDCIKDTYKKLSEAHPTKSVEELWALTSFFVAAELLRERQQENAKPLIKAADDIEKRIDNLLTPQLTFN